MTSALAILEGTFRAIELPQHTPRVDPQLCGVYLLLLVDEIVYVGSSIDVLSRLWTHRIDAKATSRRTLAKQFDRAAWLPIPRSVMHHYEGALIRALRPKHNLGGSPMGYGFDAEILYGLGLRDELTAADITEAA